MSVRQVEGIPSARICMAIFKRLKLCGGTRTTEAGCECEPFLDHLGRVRAAVAEAGIRRPVPVRGEIAFDVDNEDQPTFGCGRLSVAVGMVRGTFAG